MRGLRRHVPSYQSVRWRLLDRLARAGRWTDPGTVALTFDDGPHPGSTDVVLDLLARLEVQATFFCVGSNAEKHPALVRRAREEGHAIGSHSHTHPDPEVTPLAVLARDYARGHTAVEAALGETVTLFRPPRGYLDVPRAAQLRLRGTRPWLWNVDPQDWHHEAERDAIVAEVGSAGDRAVVLLHDWVEQPSGPRALDRSTTIDALTDAVAAIRRRGLDFSTLPG